MARDITGEKSGRLTAIKMVGTKNGRSLWLCRCDCGNEVVIQRNSFVCKKIKSCGCLRKETSRLNAIKSSKHNDSFTPLYHSWCCMKARCNYPKDKSYKNYGGRGITVCEEWENSYIAFREWSINNGYREGLTIDRIDVNGNYEPSNCRWVDVKRQENNRRNNRYITIDGETHTMTEWAEKYGIHWSVFQRRLSYGYDPLDALTIPVKEHKKKVSSCTTK